MQRVSIKSDGTGVGTKILVDGTELDNCDEAIIRIMPTGFAQVTLRLFNVPIDLDGQVCIDFRGKGKPVPPKCSGTHEVACDDPECYVRVTLHPSGFHNHV